jgi:ubiquinone/menaquinone biosynthesis C-methylase UbiE
MLDSKFWDNYFAVYDVLNELYPYQKLLKKFTDETNLQPGSKVLDAGAGTGNLSLVLKKEGIDLYTIDISEAGTRRILEKIPEAEVCVGSLCEALPYADNTFDLVVSNNVIYTLPEKDRPAAARELHRVLKPGGKIIVSNIAPNFSPLAIYLAHIQEDFRTSGPITTLLKILKFIPPTIKMFLYNARIQKENSGGHYSFLDEASQSAFLSKAGFKDISEGVRVYADQAVLHTAQK